ncbi:MAG: effector-associated domain EAD1-containing protein [Byssovorax sp.]
MRIGERKLTGKEQQALVDALLDAFPKTSDLKQLVRFGLDENLEALAGEGKLRDVVFELIEHTESRGTTDDLIAAAVEARPRNTALRAFVWRRRVGWSPVMIAGLLAVVGLGWGARSAFSPPNDPALAPSATSTVARPSLAEIEPFAPSTRGVVLAGPWKATDPAPPLYTQLLDRDEHHAVRRVPFWSSASHDDLLKRAGDAGAVLVVEVDGDGVAKAYPLGARANDPLFRGPILLRTGWDEVATVISALAQVSGPSPDLRLDALPCPKLDADKLDRFALLTLLLVPSCRAVEIDPPAFERMCMEPPDYGDEDCALALYLNAERNADKNMRAVREHLENLVRRGPERLRQEARLSLASLLCKDRMFVDKATETLLDLAKSTEPCILAQLPALAACIRTTSPDMTAEAPAPGTISTATPRVIEGWPIDPGKMCLKSERVRAMGRRAYFRARRGLWDVAADEYAEAFKESTDPAYALDLAELWLRREEPSPLKATEVLKPLQSMTIKDWTQRSRFALLRWVAALGTKKPADVAEAEGAVLKVFAERPDGGAPTTPVDEELRELACGKKTGDTCVYDILRAYSSSPETLKKGLRSP